MGKQTKINIEANRILKEKYQERGITSCELKFEGCFKSNWLSFAHKHKRIYYCNKPELLSDFNETILACVPCHQKIEDNKLLTEKMFKCLRP
jgi:hypothetical protein